MPMYSGDEEVSDAETPETESEYDHDFESEEVCMHCREIPENCECDDEFEHELDQSDECAICGMSENDPVHQEEG